MIVRVDEHSLAPPVRQFGPMIAIVTGVATPDGWQLQSLATYLGEGTSQRASASADAFSIWEIEPSGDRAIEHRKAKRGRRAIDSVWKSLIPMLRPGDRNWEISLRLGFRQQNPPSATLGYNAARPPKIDTFRSPRMTNSVNLRQDSERAQPPFELWLPE